VVIFWFLAGMEWQCYSWLRFMYFSTTLQGFQFTIFAQASRRVIVGLKLLHYQGPKGMSSGSI
jgi:hypothetical protein